MILKYGFNPTSPSVSGEDIDFFLYYGITYAEFLDKYVVQEPTAPLLSSIPRGERHLQGTAPSALVDEGFNLKPPRSGVKEREMNNNALMEIRANAIKMMIESISDVGPVFDERELMALKKDENNPPNPGEFWRRAWMAALGEPPCGDPGLYVIDTDPSAANRHPADAARASFWHGEMIRVNPGHPGLHGPLSDEGRLEEAAFYYRACIRSAKDAARLRGVRRIVCAGNEKYGFNVKPEDPGARKY